MGRARRVTAIVVLASLCVACVRGSARRDASTPGGPTAILRLIVWNDSGRDIELQASIGPLRVVQTSARATSEHPSIVEQIEVATFPGDYRLLVRDLTRGYTSEAELHLVSVANVHVILAPDSVVLKTDAIERQVFE